MPLPHKFKLSILLGLDSVTLKGITIKLTATMTPDFATSADSCPATARTIRPIAASSIHGIAFYRDSLLALDAKNGYLLQIDPATDSTTILNPNNWQEFIGATGLAVAGDTLWFAAGDSIYS
jgi:hypothetical protein